MDALPPEAYAKALDAMREEVAILDADGVIGYTNRAWQDFARQNELPGDISSVGQDYLAIIANDPDALGVADAMRAVLDGTSPSTSWEYPCHSPQENHWFEMHVTPLPDGGAVVVHTEITARILGASGERALALERERRAAAQAEGQRMQDLVNNFSHKVATPLMPLTIQLSMLAKQLPNDPDFAQRFATVVRQLDDVTNALADIQMDWKGARDRSDARATCTMEEASSRSMAHWQARARRRSLMMDMDTHTPPLRVDAATLQYAMDCIIDEALHMTPAGGTIELESSSSTKGRWVLRLRHDGPSWEIPDRETIASELAPFGGQIHLAKDTVELEFEAPEG